MLSEGSSPRSLVRFIKIAVALALSPSGLNIEQTDGLIIASARLIKSLSDEGSSLVDLREYFANAKLKLLIKYAVSDNALAALLSMVPVVSPDDLRVLHAECMDIVLNAAVTSKQEECHGALLATHKLVHLSGCSDEMFEELTNILHSKASYFSGIDGLKPPLCPVASSKRKKGKSLKKTPARSDDLTGNKSSRSVILNNEELAAVGGAAWQINEILKAEEMRAAFLQSYAEIAFSSLKVISQVYIEQCLHFESLDVTPVLAYSSLATYSALQDVDQTDIGCSESTTINQSLDHLLKCYDKFANEPVTVSADSTSMLNKNEKSAQSKHPQHGTLEEKSVKGAMNVIMIGTSILKFIVDTTTIKLVNESKVRCVKFASAYTKYAVSAMKGHHESSSFDGDDLKDILILTRSSFTYTAKLLHLVLASSTESSSSLEEAFLLANNLLDFVPAVESFAGSRFALPLVSVVKQWLPVLILGLGCRWLIGTENEMANNMWNLGDSDLPMWVVALAKNELLDAEEARENDQSEQCSGHEESLSSRKLAEMMLSLLKKGSPRIMDSVGGILLSAVQLALQKAEHSIVLGLIRFICARLLVSNSSASEKLQLTLDSLRENFFEIDRHCRDNLVDEGPRQQLESAKVLIQSVLSDV